MSFKDAKRNTEETDIQLIECAICKKCLNGLTLWVVGEVDDTLTICEECYGLLIRGSNE